MNIHMPSPIYRIEIHPVPDVRVRAALDEQRDHFEILIHYSTIDWQKRKIKRRDRINPRTTIQQPRDSFDVPVLDAMPERVRSKNALKQIDQTSSAEFAEPLEPIELLL